MNSLNPPEPKKRDLTKLSMNELQEQVTSNPEFWDYRYEPNRLLEEINQYFEYTPEQFNCLKQCLVSYLRSEIGELHDDLYGLKQSLEEAEEL